MPNESGLTVPIGRLKTLFQGGKGVKVALALGLGGMLLILLSEWIPFGGETKQEVSVVTAEQYCEAVERRLGDLLEDMDGVGTCRVYVTLESSVEYVYATEQKENADTNKNGEQISEKADTQEKIVLIKGENGETGLLLTELQPQVKGVVVVCDGGGNAAVTERVKAVVTTALNISARRVCVTK